MKSDKEKKLLLDCLRKTPIIEVACKQTGISRATYYRWREDPKFAELADEALKEGSLLMNDLAESQLLSAIKDKNLGAIVFWLKNHHPAYATKIQVEADIKNRDQELTPEQKALVERALQLAALPEPNAQEKQHEK